MLFSVVSYYRPLSCRQVLFFSKNWSRFCAERNTMFMKIEYKRRWLGLSNGQLDKVFLLFSCVVIIMWYSLPNIDCYNYHWKANSLLSLCLYQISDVVLYIDPAYCFTFNFMLIAADTLFDMLQLWSDLFTCKNIVLSS